ncbi:nucleotide exchange factor GrpE [Streptomyces sp. NPDC048664]|uniref:nucleotide exchange factor GrpE n=1 Tax=Streptomyces sp. NPDC048664 TaxID=3154505 RepID=UPI0034443A5F
MAGIPALRGGEHDTMDPSRRPDEDLRCLLQERTADLQRVKAEYDNYRKRVRRDRLAVREAAAENVLRSLLPVLDAMTAARRLGEVDPGLDAVADVLDASLASLGLRVFGLPGDPFDPTRHEAVSHRVSPDADRPRCAEILSPGYRVGDRLLRAARVTVVGPPTD